MSVAAELWKQIAARTDAIPTRKPPHRASQWEARPKNPQHLSLVHQLFFPAAALPRKSVLLVSADEHSNLSGLSQDLAITLSKASGQRVAIIQDDPSPVSQNARGSSGLAPSPWQAYATPISERVWRIASSFVCNERSQPDESKTDSFKGLGSTFDYFLLSAVISDFQIPILCSLCDAAVLLLTANVTRREAALRSKEQLLLQKVNLVGTVLDQRTLPIPEAIYRRL